MGAEQREIDSHKKQNERLEWGHIRGFCFRLRWFPRLADKISQSFDEGLRAVGRDWRVG